MIISLRAVNYEDLKTQISKDDKIVLLSCNTCVVACGVGGMQKMTTLANMLDADGYNILGKDLVSIGCTTNLIQRHRDDIKKRRMYEEATVIIALICENGLQAVEAVFHDKKVISITRTVGVGNFTSMGSIVLTHPFESTGMELNSEGYELSEVAEELDLYEDFFDEDEAAERETEYVTLTINGEEISAEKGRNLLQVCEENGISVPHLCYHEELSEAGVCRLCLVKIAGRRDLMPACCTQVDEGMEVVTHDEELEHNRRIILELVMASHNHNCLTCSKGIPDAMGSCELQNLIRQYGIERSRYEENREDLEPDHSSPIIEYDPNKCILCGRCARACEEIAGLCNIGFVHRGSKTVIAAGLNKDMNQSDCAECMACVNVCPTGALTERVVRYSGEKWEKQKVFCDLTV